MKNSSIQNLRKLQQCLGDDRRFPKLSKTNDKVILGLMNECYGACHSKYKKVGEDLQINIKAKKEKKEDISVENSKYEKNTQDLYSLASLVSGRGIDGNQARSDQNGEQKMFNNPNLAGQILVDTMKLNGSFETVWQTEKIKLIDPSLENREVGQIMDILQEEVGFRIDDKDNDIWRYIEELGYTDLFTGQFRGKKCSELSTENQGKMNILVQLYGYMKGSQINLNEKNIRTEKDFGANILAVVNEWRRLSYVNGELWASKLQDTMGDVEKYGLTGTKKKVFDLYKKITGVGIRENSDETDDMLREGAKIAPVIIGTIAVNIFFPPSALATIGFGSAMVGSAIVMGASGVILNQLVFQPRYNSTEEFFQDIGTQFLFDSATVGIGMKFFGPIIKNTIGRKQSLTSLSKNFGFMMADVTTGVVGEAIRQDINGQEINILQMIKQGGLMGTIFFMMGAKFKNKSAIENLIKLISETPALAKQLGGKAGEVVGMLKKKVEVLESEGIGNGKKVDKDDKINKKIVKNEIKVELQKSKEDFENSVIDFLQQDEMLKKMMTGEYFSNNFRTQEQRVVFIKNHLKNLVFSLNSFFMKKTSMLSYTDDMTVFSKNIDALLYQINNIHSNYISDGNYTKNILSYSNDFGKNVNNGLIGFTGIKDITNIVNQGSSFNEILNIIHTIFTNKLPEYIPRDFTTKLGEKENVMVVGVNKPEYINLLNKVSNIDSDLIYGFGSGESLTIQIRDYGHATNIRIVKNSVGVYEVSYDIPKAFNKSEVEGLRGFKNYNEIPQVDFSESMNQTANGEFNIEPNENLTDVIYNFIDQLPTDGDYYNFKTKKRIKRNWY